MSTSTRLPHSLRALRVQRALLLGLTLFASSSVGRSDDLREYVDRYYEARIRDAVVKIDVRFFDTFGQRIDKPREYGHGIFVSDKGVLVTAAHVIFPSIDEVKKAAAVDYSLVLSTWNKRIGGFDETAEIPGRVLAEFVVHGGEGHVVNCPEATDIRMLCLKSDISATRDFAVVAVPEAYTTPVAFVDVVGPADSIQIQNGDRRSKFFVQADFHRNGGLLRVPVTLRSDGPAPRTFYSTAAQKFKKGISGSPVFVANDVGRRSVLLSGIVVTANKDDAVDGHEFTSLLMQDVFFADTGSKTSQRVRSMFGGERSWDCDRHYASFPSPLLEGYFATASATSSEAGRRFIDCASQVFGWMITATTLVQYEEISRAAQDSTVTVPQLSEALKSVAAKVSQRTTEISRGNESNRDAAERARKSARESAVGVIAVEAGRLPGNAPDKVGRAVRGLAVER